MNHFPILSIIIPCYNIEDYIQKNIESLLEQEIPEVEFLFVNDGSTDRTLEILQKYQQMDSRIQIISQPNAGLSAARNVGLQQCTGQYVYFLDGDDFLEKGCLKRLITLMQKEELDILQFAHQWVDVSDNVLFPCTQENSTQVLPGKEWLLTQSIPIYICIYIFSRALLLNNLCFFNEELLSAEDHIFLPATILHAQRIRYEKQICVNYVQRPTSLVHTNHLQRSRNDLKVIQLWQEEWEGLVESPLYQQFYLPHTIALYNDIIYNSSLGHFSLKNLLGSEKNRKYFLRCYHRQDLLLCKIVYWLFKWHLYPVLTCLYCLFYPLHVSGKRNS